MTRDLNFPVWSLFDQQQQKGKNAVGMTETLEATIIFKYALRLVVRGHSNNTWQFQVWFATAKRHQETWYFECNFLVYQNTLLEQVSWSKFDLVLVIHRKKCYLIGSHCWSMTDKRTFLSSLLRRHLLDKTVNQGFRKFRNCSNMMKLCVHFTNILEQLLRQYSCV